MANADQSKSRAYIQQRKAEVELAQAIPPPYTEWIGRLLIPELKGESNAA